MPIADVSKRLPHSAMPRIFFTRFTLNKHEKNYCFLSYTGFFRQHNVLGGQFWDSRREKIVQSRDLRRLYLVLFFFEGAGTGNNAEMEYIINRIYDQ